MKNLGFISNHLLKNLLKRSPEVVDSSPWIKTIKNSINNDKILVKNKKLSKNLKLS